MIGDNLLLWMSARKKGSWQQFRAAVEEQHFDSHTDKSLDDEDTEESGFPIYHELRLNFQRLAHAEFINKEGQYGWRVVPPALSVYAGPSGKIGVLCGARTLGTLERFRTATQSSSLHVSSVLEAPQTLTIIGADDHLMRQIAMECGLQTQIGAPLSVLLALPSIENSEAFLPAEMPIGDAWSVERFSCSQKIWAKVTPDDARRAVGGLFRFRHQYRREIYRKKNTETFAISSQVGKYLLLREKRRRVMKYNSETFTMHIPAVYRPPMLVERALILCSGQLPAYSAYEGTGFLEYSNVSAEVAQAAAAVLGQKLQ